MIFDVGDLLDQYHLHNLYTPHAVDLSCLLFIG